MYLTVPYIPCLLYRIVVCSLNTSFLLCRPSEIDSCCVPSGSNTPARQKLSFSQPRGTVERDQAAVNYGNNTSRSRNKSLVDTRLQQALTTPTGPVMSRTVLGSNLDVSGFDLIEDIDDHFYQAPVRQSTTVYDLKKMEQEERQAFTDNDMSKIEHVDDGEEDNFKGIRAGDNDDVEMMLALEKGVPSVSFSSLSLGFKTPAVYEHQQQEALTDCREMPCPPDARSHSSGSPQQQVQ